MKVTYIALDPLRYPRIKKIAYSLRECSDIDFHVMLPKVRLIAHKSRTMRMVYAVVNYVAVMLQILFVRSNIFWVANCPDILVIPLVLRRKRYILEYRSPWSFEVEIEFGLKPFFQLAAIIERMALEHAALITLTTSRLMEKVKSLHKPVYVIPNYPLKTFGTITVSRQELRESNDCTEEDRVVLFVGKLSRVEGADMIPKIVKDVLARAEDKIGFWIVGDGPFHSALREFAKSAPRNIKLFGWQPHERIPDFISAADVCIAPRHKSAFQFLYNEENVFKISEYMFFEKPIVACGIAESQEYLLVDEDEMAEAILRALSGLVRRPKRRIWEDHCEKKIRQMLSIVESSKSK